MALTLTSKTISIALTLSTLALCALFTAHGAASYAASQLIPIDRGNDTTASPPRAALHAPGADPPDVLAILKRNAFDHTTGPLPRPPEPPPSITRPDPSPEQWDPRHPPPACDPSVKLVASVYSERAPEASFGSLSDGSSPPLLYREGSTIAGHEVAHIFPSAVYMRKSDGKLCSLTMFGGVTEQASMTATAAAAPVAAAPQPALDAAITKVGEASYTVKRSFVDGLLGDPSGLMALARVVPHREDGQVVGLKLYGIRRDSPLGKLGMQNGDLLRSINGMNVADPSVALDALAKLRSASDLKVALTRRGQDASLSFGIRD